MRTTFAVDHVTRQSSFPMYLQEKAERTGAALHPDTSVRTIDLLPVRGHHIVQHGGVGLSEVRKFYFIEQRLGGERGGANGRHGDRA